MICHMTEQINRMVRSSRSSSKTYEVMDMYEPIKDDVFARVSAKIIVFTAQSRDAALLGLLLNIIDWLYSHGTPMTLDLFWRRGIEVTENTESEETTYVAACRVAVFNG